MFELHYHWAECIISDGIIEKTAVAFVLVNLKMIRTLSWEMLCEDALRGWTSSFIVLSLPDATVSSERA